jgi:hypothetical protein
MSAILFFLSCAMLSMGAAPMTGSFFTASALYRLTALAQPHIT